MSVTATRMELVDGIVETAPFTLSLDELVAKRPAIKPPTPAATKSSKPPITSRLRRFLRATWSTMIAVLVHWIELVLARSPNVAGVPHLALLPQR